MLQLSCLSFQSPFLIKSKIQPLYILLQKTTVNNTNSSIFVLTQNFKAITVKLFHIKYQFHLPQLTSLSKISNAFLYFSTLLKSLSEGLTILVKSILCFKSAILTFLAN